MKRIFSFLCVLVLCPGCISGPEKIVRSEIFVRHGTNELRISNPKDVEFEDAMISPVDGVVRIKKYRSTGNVAALRAAEEQARAQAEMWGEIREDAREWRDTALRAYGIPTPSRQTIPPLLSVEAQKIPPQIEAGKTNVMR